MDRANNFTAGHTTEPTSIPASKSASSSNRRGGVQTLKRLLSQTQTSRMSGRA